jgi:hypothetical protein
MVVDFINRKKIKIKSLNNGGRKRIGWKLN